MYARSISFYAGMLSLFLFPQITCAESFEYYKNVPTFDQAANECTPDDVGDIQISCRYIEIGHIDGLNVTDSQVERLGRLKKYWIGSFTYMKIAGLGCGRGNTQQEAEQSALGKAASAAHDRVTALEENTLSAISQHMAFNKFDEGSKCVRTPNTRSGQQDVAAVEKKSKQKNDTSQQQTVKPLDFSKNSRIASFTLHNADRYSMSVAFYSQSRRGVVWPGAHSHWTLTGTNTYNLACNPGEKICFGAWREHQTVTWAAGHGDGGCDHCCIQCGGSMETTLNDGGEDAYPQSASSGGNAVNDLANIIGAIGLGVGIANSLNNSGDYSGNSGAFTGGVQTYAPSAIRRNGSGISGTTR